MKTIHRQDIHLTCLLLWKMLGGIFILAVITVCLIPMPDTSGGIPQLDKVFHFLSFGGLTAWFLMLYRGPRTGLLIPLAVLALGLLIEALQGMTSYRSASGADAVADLLGIVLAAMFAVQPLSRSLQWVERRILFVK